MLKIYIFLLCFLLVTAFGQRSQPQKITPGQEYAAGTHLTMPSMGISFTLPADWLGGIPVNGQALIMGSRTKTGVGLVIMQSAISKTEIEQYLNQPQDLGEGVVLYPQGTIHWQNSRFSVPFKGTTYIGRAQGIIGPNSSAVLYFFAGPPSDAGYFQTVLDGLVSSTRFSKPQNTTDKSQWKQFLSGMMLKKLDSYYSSGGGSYGGYSSEETLHLCQDGSYAYFSSSSMSADGGGGVSGYSGGSGQEYGRWNVEVMGNQAVLILNPRQGTPGRYTITFDGEKTFLEGDRVYRVQSDRCQ